MIPFLYSVAHAANISAAIPGTNANTTSSSPGAFIANFYQFSLFIAGILAFGVIVYGGIRYMTSAGNPSGATEAKEWIQAALLGLLLLAGAYFILGVVNPQLKVLTLPTLANTNTQSNSQGTGSGGNTTPACGGNTNGTCPQGQTCNSTGVGYVCGGQITNAPMGSSGNCSGQVCSAWQTCVTSPYSGYLCQNSCSGNSQGTCPPSKTCQPLGGGYGFACQ